MANLIIFFLTILLGTTGRRKSRAELTAEGKELLDLHIFLDSLGVHIAQHGHALTAKERVVMLINCGARENAGRQPARYYSDN
jgi:hypothetical protein